MYKTQHWFKINRIVARKMWGNLSHETRDIIAADSLHLSETFKWFEAQVENETNRLYEDGDFSYNNKYTFAYER